MNTMNVELKGMLMKNSNMVSNSIFADNFDAERVQHEKMKYGRLPDPQAAAHPHVYTKHSIEPAYGQYDRPINESV